MVSTEMIDVALAELDSVTERLTPKIVVNAARPEDHVLHPMFEWDDSIAAEEHRLATARRILSIHVKRVHQGRVLEVPLYVRDPDAPSGEQGYVRALRLRQEPEGARAALIAEMLRVSHMLSRARDFARLVGREEDIAKLEGQVSSFIESMGSTGEDARPTA